MPTTWIEFGWSERDAAKLREMWIAGEPTRAIAEALGTTRNAVIGKANRMGLPARSWRAFHRQRPNQYGVRVVAVLAFLLLPCLAHAEPYTLVTIWPSGHVKHEPTTTRATCELAMTDALDGFALPLDEMLPATAAHCEPYNSFKPGWGVIPGYNAPRRK